MDTMDSTWQYYTIATLALMVRHMYSPPGNSYSALMGATAPLTTTL
jgi:hypothetical protein